VPELAVAGRSKCVYSALCREQDCVRLPRGRLDYSLAVHRLEECRAQFFRVISASDLPKLVVSVQRTSERV